MNINLGWETTQQARWNHEPFLLETTTTKEGKETRKKFHNIWDLGLFCSVMYASAYKWYLVYPKCSINICWLSEFTEAFLAIKHWPGAFQYVIPFNPCNNSTKQVFSNLLEVTQLIGEQLEFKPNILLVLKKFHLCIYLFARYLRHLR